MEARFKERAQGAREGVGESKDVGPVGHVVEGDDACFVVQENAHAARGLLQAEGGLRGRESFVLGPAALPHQPVPVGGRGGDLPLPAHRLTAHPQDPLGLVPHVHLPVVTARREGLGAQDADHEVEPLGGVKHRLPPVPKLHTPAVLGQDELGMRCVGVQGHGHCRGHREERFG